MLLGDSCTAGAIDTPGQLPWLRTVALRCKSVALFCTYKV